MTSATLVCVPITVHSAESALAQASAARDAGATMVELRIDDFFTGSEDGTSEEIAQRETLEAIVDGVVLPCIVTCRVSSEGGGYEGDSAARVRLYEHLKRVARPPRYFDVEMASLMPADRELGARRADEPSLIVSMHDFAGRPSDLLRRLARLQEVSQAAVYKVAYRARSLRDNLELLSLPRMLAHPTIALGMGEFGLLSRVLTPKFGGFLTFASLQAQTVTAPGQPTVRDLLHIYRFASINPATRVYGIVGWPVGHSLSPLLHNAGFEGIGYDGVYLPLPIGAAEDPETTYLSFKATMLELLDHAPLTFCGGSVTIPHKEHLVRLAQEQRWGVDDASGAIGAANTFIAERDADGALRSVWIENTDARGLHTSLTQAIGEYAGRTIGIIGAGGAARAAAYAILNAGASIILYNRNPRRAARVASDLNRFAYVSNTVTSAPLDALAISPCDGFINCTPLGLAGGPDAGKLPLPIDRMEHAPERVFYFDTVYNPLETGAMAAARRKGWRVIGGVGMFVEQAALQFEAWTARPAPRALFDRLAREALMVRATEEP